MQRSETELVLLTGKGGTGKTTCAAALALHWGELGQPVLVASLDPAHNLGDVLGLPLGAEPLELGPAAQALEVDLAGRMRRQQQRTQRLVRQRYRTLSVAGLDGLVSLLGQAPGAEEQAAVEAMIELHQRARAAGQRLVLDLPPSGQALRMLTLAQLTARWCDDLLRLRRQILGRQGTLAQLFEEAGDEAPAAASAGRDPVARTLGRLGQRHGDLAQLLRDERRCCLVTVSLPGRLSQLEADRLRRQLLPHGIHPCLRVLNRWPEGESGPQRGDAEALCVLPQLADEPVGQQALRPLGQLLAGALSCN